MTDAKSKTQVWRATIKPLDVHIGFLITEPGQLERPIAFIAGNEGNEVLTELLAIAEIIASDPREAQLNNCIDLRHYGQPNSIAPMPSFIYGLLYSPINEMDGTDDPAGGEAQQEVFPWCKFRLAELQKNAPKK